jgi:hypothetical protein
MRIRLGVIVLIIAFFALILLLFLPSITVSYSIRLPSQEIPQGTNTILYYNVENGLVLDDIYNVEFTYWIMKGNFKVVEETIIPIGTILRRSGTGEKSIELETLSLNKGDYTIWTSIRYSIGEGQLGLGNVEAKYLSLRLTIY